MCVAVDVSAAGKGRASVHVAGPRSTPRVLVLETESRGKLEATFEPVEAGEHLVSIEFNDQPVLDSPFHCHVFDLDDVTADLSGLDRGMRVGESREMTLNTTGIAIADFKVSLKDELGTEAPVSIRERGADACDVIVSPVRVGRHVLVVAHGGDEQVLRGFPCEFSVVDPNLAFLSSASRSCFIGDAAQFKGDCTTALDLRDRSR